MNSIRSRPIATFAVVMLAAVSPARAIVSEIDLGGFSVELDVLVAGAPEAVYDAMTGDVSGWWDHNFSGDPAAFYIEAKPGGGFYEIFDESGDGVKHAEVIYAHRGRMLRLRGPLGFSGKAMDFVFTLEFAAENDSTRIRFVANAAGQVEKGWAEAIEGVWTHFLVERFKPYVEGGELGE